EFVRLLQNLPKHEIEIDIRLERQTALVPLEKALELRRFQRMELNHRKDPANYRRESEIGGREPIPDSRLPTADSAANASSSSEILRYASAELIPRRRLERYSRR